jgi:tRNA threonylcarbamoyladenosine biosynthesis protein TsaE
VTSWTPRATDSFVTVAPADPEDAADVLAVVREAFGARPALDPPADASAETLDSIRDRLAGDGGLLARRDGEPVGALLFDVQEDAVFLRRFGVVPAAQGHGVAGLLVATAVDMAARLGDHRTVAVVAREELPETIAFWVRQGFRETGRTSPYVELRRVVGGTELHVPDAEAMRRIGADVAGRLRAGDLVLLVGDLGAGKTTFTQGLGEGLGVRGPVTSPTFVIARVHPSEVGGPALVHVDAYRLIDDGRAGLAELDDLDLDASLDESVTVVEWGEGVAEQLADSRLEVRIERGAGVEDEARVVRLTGVGPRWEGEAW